MTSSRCLIFLLVQSMHIFFQSVVFGLLRYMTYALLEYLGRWQLMPGGDDSSNCGLSASICPSSNLPEPCPSRFCLLITASTEPVWGCSSTAVLLIGRWLPAVCGGRPLQHFFFCWGGVGGDGEAVLTVVVIKISEAANVRLLLFRSLAGLYKRG